MNYREDVKKADETRRLYADGLEELIRKKQNEAAEKRKEYSKKIFESPEACRADLRKMLGWPLSDCDAEGLPAAEKTELSKEDGYTVFRIRFEILDGLIMTGLYFERDGEGKKPLVLVQHGGWGTPELISGIYGATQNYNGMLERVLQYGVHAFAPQLLLWEKSSEVPCNRKSVDERLKRVGGSITAVELYGLMRILDWFTAEGKTSSFGMLGLSYGGFYTLFMAALDTRIKASVSCSYFNTRDRYPWSDWMWFGQAEKFDDAEIACLIYPRKLCIALGTRDDLFDYESGKAAYETLLSISKGVGGEWLGFWGFDGTHEFPHNDTPIQELVSTLFHCESTMNKGE